MIGSPEPVLFERTVLALAEKPLVIGFLSSSNSSASNNLDRSKFANENQTSSSQQRASSGILVFLK
ncbi:hypothetical protein F2981_05650 [Sinorhizobium meliloti]|nr:hypothetical protein [Sinorhizobium meliloti]